MNYAILPALREHLPFLPGIEDAAGELFPLEDLPEPARSTSLSAKAFEGALNRELLWVVVADESGLPVAFLMADVLDGCMHLVEVDVHPDHGRRGIGSRLLDHVLAVARQRGFEAVTLTTFGHLAWNAPFYARHGFQAVRADGLGEGLARVLEKEQALGMRRRMAMRKDLPRRDPVELARSVRFTSRSPS